MLRQDGPLRTPLSGFTTLTLIRLQVLRSCLFEPAVCCWFIFGPDRQLFSLACLVYRSQSVLKLRSVKLPMKENVSGYSRNPCSLNRERDTAFAAKLLTLPTGFFWQRNLRSGWRVRQYDLTTSLRQRRRRAISQ